MSWGVNDMRKSLIVLPVVFGLLGALTLAGSANADTTAGTPVTFEVTGGALAITVPASTVSLGSVAASASAQSVSAHLGTVTVTDSRGGTVGWTVTVGAVDFSGPQNVSVGTVGASGYTTPGASITGVANVTATSLDSLYPPAAVQVATGVAGVNSATWNPTISVTIPANAVTGTYSTTITHSVS
jgi:hypothetical protein